MLRCADESLYTGISNDVTKRLQTHNQGKGAKYTKPRLPVKLVYLEKVLNKSAALKREIEIKKMSHFEKNNLSKLTLNLN